VLGRTSIVVTEHVGGGMSERRYHRTLSPSRLNIRTPSHSQPSSSHGDCCVGARRGDLLLLFLPRAGAAAEGVEPGPRRGGRIVLEGVVLRRGRRSGAGANGRAGGRAAEAGGIRRCARVQVPVRAGGPRARGHRRGRRAAVRAQAAPGGRPQHRQDRQELPAGEDLAHLNLDAH
jgi:hypothetical protein